MQQKPTPAGNAGTRFSLSRLQKAVAEAKRCGFQVRSEWLGGSAQGWCEFGGRRVLFIDLSLSVDEQLDHVEAALQAARSDQRAA